MSFSLEVNALKEVVLGSKIDGTSEITSITGIASLKNAQKGDLSFLANPKYKSEVKDTNASLVLLPEDYRIPSGFIQSCWILPPFEFS
jgi:UDP-3-O-[3-hydroxymyristoyl] glucosamine N-acyltransferase